VKRPRGQAREQPRLGVDQRVDRADQRVAARDDVSGRDAGAAARAAPSHGEAGEDRDVGEIPDQVEAVAHAQDAKARRLDAAQDLVAPEALQVSAESLLPAPRTGLPR